MNIFSETPRGREPFESAPGQEVREHESEADALSLSNLIQIAWENRWLLAMTTGLGLALAATYIETETPLYRTSAQVMLETSQENVINVDRVVPRRTGDFIELNTEIEVLRSSELMARTVDALSLGEDPEFNPALRPRPAWQALIDYDGWRETIGLAPEPRPVAPEPAEARQIASGILRSKVSISLVPGTVIFSIAVETQDPERSATIANTIAELYVASQREAKFEAMDEAMSWVGSRVVELKAELEAAEAAIDDFAADAALVNEETFAASTQRLKSMRARETELAETAAGLEARADRLEALRAERDFAGLAEALADPRLRAAAEALAQAPASESALARFDGLFDRFLERLRIDAGRASSQAASAAQSMAEIEASVDAQSSDLLTLRQMQRETEATRLIYESFLSRLKEISVQQGVQEADSRILALASVPRGPAYPDVQRSFLAGGALGLVLGFGLIGLRTVLRNSVRTPEELEGATGLGVLGVIPDGRIQRPDRLLRYIVDKPASEIAEAIRNLRTAIQLSNIDVTPKVILVTSSVPDEGKSILAASLALTSASAGKKVLLIDADLRRRILRKYFDLDAKAGLISLLSGQTGWDKTIRHDPRTGLDLLIADDEKVTPVDFFASKHFEDFLAAARDTYDYIFLDTPPVLAVPETRVIAQHADAVIYSVRWNSTTRRMVRAGLDLFRQVNVRVTGLTLTRVDPRRMDRYGYYGYGYGSRGRKLKKYYSG